MKNVNVQKSLPIHSFLSIFLHSSLFTFSSASYQQLLTTCPWAIKALLPRGTAVSAAFTRWLWMTKLFSAYLQMKKKKDLYATRAAVKLYPTLNLSSHSAPKILTGVTALILNQHLLPDPLHFWNCSIIVDTRKEESWGSKNTVNLMFWNKWLQNIVKQQQMNCVRWKAIKEPKFLYIVPHAGTFLFCSFFLNIAYNY